MNNVAEVDVMNSLMFSSGATDLPQVEELNALLYRSADEPTPIFRGVPARVGLEDCGKVTVQISDRRARIRIKLVGKMASKLSIDQVTAAAVKAITDELEKVTP